MFFHIVKEKNMRLHPRYFGPRIREKLVMKLREEVEGTCSRRHGFVVTIIGIDDIGEGKICEVTGFAIFPVTYQCVVFMLFIGEVLEAAVTIVNKMGFFAEAGPLQIFVSTHLIPQDMVFQTGDIRNYTSNDKSVKIQKDSEVRLKIIGTRVDPTEIFCIATMNEDFLGVINDDPVTAIQHSEVIHQVTQ